MLAHIVSIPIRISVIVALVSIRGHVFLVGRPANTLQLQKVDNGRDVVGNISESVAWEPEEVASDGRNVVGFTGVGHGVVAREQDALVNQLLEVVIFKGRLVVGILEPDLNEAVENLAGHDWRVGEGIICSANVERRLVSRAAKQNKDRWHDSGDMCNWAYDAAGAVNVAGGISESLAAEHATTAPRRTEYLSSMLVFSSGGPGVWAFRDCP